MTQEPRIFPLHLTPFEHYMLTDDRAQFPMCFVVQFDFSGHLVREAFESAVAAALERHPLLRAKIQPAKANQDCWVSAERRPTIDWGSIDDPLTLEHGEFINLREESGLRLWVRNDEQRAVVTGQFHHACCDGIGSYQFLGDVLWNYACQTGDQAPAEPQPELDPRLLRLRGLASYDPAEFRKSNGRFRADLGEFRKIMLGRFTPIQSARKNPPASFPLEFPGIRSHVFGKAEFKQLRLAALDSGQTTNDALIADLFTTIKNWNRRKRPYRLPQSLCVMVPMDLRTSDSPAFSAVNCVTYALIRRSRKVLSDPGLLDDSLRQEATILKQQRHSSRFMNVVVVARRHPILTRIRLGINRCMVSAILSNTGDPTKHFNVPLPRERGAVRCGNLVLEDISGVPPMRIKSHATISIFTYRRMLKICFRCNPRLFSGEDTQALLDDYVRHLSQRFKP